jgi:cell division inhibitor SulA
MAAASVINGEIMALHHQLMAASMAKMASIINGVMAVEASVMKSGVNNRRGVSRGVSVSWLAKLAKEKLKTMLAAAAAGEAKWRN